MIVLALLLLLSSTAEAKVFKTPEGTTCATVRHYYAQLGGMEGVIAYGKANNIQLTDTQKRQALACLDSRRKRLR